MVAAGVITIGEHQIPSIPAILATVGHDVASLPQPILRRQGQQVGPPAAVDAVDHWLWYPHGVQSGPGVPETHPKLSWGS